MAGKFEIFKDRAGEFRFRLRAANGEPILASEGYTTKSGCQNGIASVQINSQIDARYDVRLTTSGQPYFVLQAANGEIIGRSESYSSEAALKNGLESVRRNGNTTNIVDLTT